MEAHYHTLGLYPGASSSAISKAYKKLSRGVDPEKTAEESDEVAEFQQATIAYEAIREQEMVVKEVRIRRKLSFLKNLLFHLARTSYLDYAN